MGFFAKLSEMACKQAVQIMKAYRDGKSNPVDVMNALKTLANGGKLYRKREGKVYNLESYFWVNGSDLENISGWESYSIQTVSSDEIVSHQGYRFRKVYAQDCENIRFNNY